MYLKKGTAPTVTGDIGQRPSDKGWRAVTDIYIYINVYIIKNMWMLVIRRYIYFGSQGVETKKSILYLSHYYQD